MMTNKSVGWDEFTLLACEDPGQTLALLRLYFIEVARAAMADVRLTDDPHAAECGKAALRVANHLGAIHQLDVRDAVQYEQRLATRAQTRVTRKR